MIYFIPAWYSKNEWKENEQFWYTRSTQTETDETVKQVQLFQRNNICEYKILLLSYAPNFRHFLHRQSVYRAPYWSVFDAIQETKRKKQSLLSYHNLNWPKNTEFVYTSFALLAMLNEEKYAQVEFGEYGNPIEISLYKDNQINRKNIYDDRGFVSCTSVYENNKKVYDRYLNDNGIWKLCCFADGKVTINPKSNYYLILDREIKYKKDSYDSMDEIIEEVLSSYIDTTGENDMFCIAAHNHHLKVVDEVLNNKNVIYSLFGDRVEINDSTCNLIKNAKYIIADTKTKQIELEKSNSLGGVNIETIPPYDTRIDYNISLKLHVQKILLPIDYLSNEELEKTVIELMKYMEQNKDARVHLFTRISTYNREEVILNTIKHILEKNNYSPNYARKDSGKKFELLPEEERYPILFVVEQCVNELSVSKCVREQRILVDLANKPDLFLQISCVSMGVPQILKKENQYMIDGRNGSVNNSVEDLPRQLEYYLENLGNWNEANLCSYELSKEHTNEYLINKWKEVINNFE